MPDEGQEGQTPEPCEPPSRSIKEGRILRPTENPYVGPPVPPEPASEPPAPTAPPQQPPDQGSGE
jgi:hypothetical protein